MALTIPTSIAYTIRQGSRGLAVFALQRVCNKILGVGLSEDMDFGPATQTAAKRLQGRIGVETDGIVGPGTQWVLAKWLCNRQEAYEYGALPDELLFSKVSYESAGYLGAVNWSVAGGVDCGITQRRVFEDQYNDDAAVKRAFDPIYQLGLSGDRMVELHDIFLTRPGIGGREGYAWRVSVLNHNYPTLADAISRVGVSGLSTYYKSPQSWVTGFGLKFPDGAAIRTPLEWGQRYALGSFTHDEPGQAVKLANLGGSL